MEREIKFRGKRVDKEEFAFGDLLTGMGYKKGRFFVLPHLSYYPSDCHSVDGYEVIPETIGQYIGLKDQNGKEIYEGDIIECWSEGLKARGVVRHRIDGLWIMYPAWQNTKMWHLMPDQNGNTTVEVLGNIHDNPELLKDGRD